MACVGGYEPSISRFISAFVVWKDSKVADKISNSSHFIRRGNVTGNDSIHPVQSILRYIQISRQSDHAAVLFKGRKEDPCLNTGLA